MIIGDGGALQYCEAGVKNAPDGLSIILGDRGVGQRHGRHTRPAQPVLDSASAFANVADEGGVGNGHSTYEIEEATTKKRRAVVVEGGVGDSHRTTTVEEAAGGFRAVLGQDAVDNGQYTPIADAPATTLLAGERTIPVSKGESLEGEGSSFRDPQDTEIRGAGVPLDDGVFRPPAP